MGKREQKARRMAEVIERWEASGLSGRNFSVESRVPEAKLWYWKRRIGVSHNPPAFVPLRILPEVSPSAPPSFELFLPDGRRLVIPPCLTGRPLRQLLSALRSC
jgi:hypothetical protein